MRLWMLQSQFVSILPLLSLFSNLTITDYAHLSGLSYLSNYKTLLSNRFQKFEVGWTEAAARGVLWKKFKV